MFLMKSSSAPSITSIDKLRDGIIVMFDDGKCALYSASLLHATLPQAHEFARSEWKDEQRCC
jgi:hypothetical protein